MINRYFEHNGHFVNCLFFQSAYSNIGFQYKFYKIHPYRITICQKWHHLYNRLVYLSVVQGSTNFCMILCTSLKGCSGIRTHQFSFHFISFVLWVHPPFLVLCHNSMSVDSFHKQFAQQYKTKPIFTFWGATGCLTM